MEINNCDLRLFPYNPQEARRNEGVRTKVRVDTRDKIGARGNEHVRTKARVDTVDKIGARRSECIRTKDTADKIGAGGNFTIKDRSSRNGVESRIWGNRSRFKAGNKSIEGSKPVFKGRSQDEGAAKLHVESQGNPHINSRNSDLDDGRTQYFKTSKARTKRYSLEGRGELTDIPHEEKNVPVEANKKSYYKSKQAGLTHGDIGPRAKVEVGFARKSLLSSEEGKTWTSFKSRRASSRTSVSERMRPSTSSEEKTFVAGRSSSESKSAETTVATDEKGLETEVADTWDETVRSE